MADNQQQQIDHYDFINAPQFVDFSDLAAQDDPDADRFFETHKEEDDFMIPLDINAISPTVQLLYGNGNSSDENNEHYSNEANKAAIAAGLEDVKIEYYASPPPQSTSILSQPNSNKKSLTSVYGTPQGAQSGGSSVTSFYTPTGENEDKENLTPTQNSVLSASKTGPASSQKLGKWKEETPPPSIEKPQNISINKLQKLDSSQTTTPAYSSPSGQIQKSSDHSSSAADSLLSRLDQLSIVSSDEDDDVPSNYPPHPTSATTYNTFSENKMTFLDMPTSVRQNDATSLNSSSTSSSVSDTDATLVLAPAQEKQHVDEYALDSDSSDDTDDFAAVSMEMRSNVNDILKKLDAEISMEDDDENPRCSIVVAPRVGEQVHWGSALNVDMEAEKEGASYYVEGHENGDSYDGSGENTLDMYGFDICVGDGSMTQKNRRASSVGDLVRAIEVEPKERQFETFGYNPRVGITIPKTPDVSSARNDSYRDHYEYQEETVARPEVSGSSKNGCYFEIEAPPKHPKSVRRVSSCSDLISLQQKAKLMSGRRQPQKLPQKKALTIPRTPDTLKRAPKSQVEKYAAFNASSAGSTSSKYGGNSLRTRAVAGAASKGPSVGERLAAAKSRQPIKATHYVSMAEAMIKYQKNTPDRFRSLPRGRVVPEKRANSCDSRSRRGGPSPARSPDCTASTTLMAPRTRGESFSERNALRTNTARNVAAGGAPVLPKKVELKPTIPRPFNLSCGQRNRPAPVVPKDEDQVDFKFKARPAPSKLLHENPTSLLHKSRPQVKVTQPMSPHFASDDRLRERHQKRVQTKSPEAKPAKSQIGHQKPSRLPTATLSSARVNHQADEHKTTVAQPFSSSFDARQKEILRRKEEKIKHEMEEAKKGYEFHANPVPRFSVLAKKLPKKKPVEVTHVEPFRLKSDERGAQHQEAFKKKLEEEEQRKRELARFHAQPADVIHKPPFEPERPTRVIEGPSDFHLATEKRAAEREQFDEQLREREREEEERRREEQELLEEIQRQEDLEKRRLLVHKAQPFKAPKPFQLKASGRALTVPQSPAFSALPSERRIKPHSPQQQ